MYWFACSTASTCRLRWSWDSQRRLPWGCCGSKMAFKALKEEFDLDCIIFEEESSQQDHPNEGKFNKEEFPREFVLNVNDVEPNFK